MKVVFFVVLACSYALAFDVSDEFINEINSKQNSWVAGRNFAKDTPMTSIKHLLGAKELPKEILDTIPIKLHEDVDVSALPETFDARTQWPKCKTIKEVADQSACGSCWAVSVASAISDRICVHSDGKQQAEISARNLMACSFGNGCHGGYPVLAWQYWRSQGLVTGGAYGSKIGCQPYPFEQCEHHTSGKKPACPSSLYATPKCVKQCDNSTINFNDDLIHGASGYRVSSKEEQIQQEIYTNGPITAGFSVYADFVNYKSGVYQHTSGSFEGRHAVRVIGWGVEKDVKYWLVMNSWNEDWGDKGTFKIKRGNNECQFESEMAGGLPK